MSVYRKTTHHLVKSYWDKLNIVNKVWKDVYKTNVISFRIIGLKTWLPKAIIYSNCSNFYFYSSLKLQCHIFSNVFSINFHASYQRGNSELSQVCRTNDEELDRSSLYWISKIHKYPYIQCLNAWSSKCFTKHIFK